MMTAQKMNEITTNVIKEANERTRKWIEQWLRVDKIEENLSDAARKGCYGATVYLGSLPETHKYAACEYFEKLGYYVESAKGDCIYLDWGEDASLEEDY